jgi:hypothetical protein
MVVVVLIVFSDCVLELGTGSLSEEKINVRLHLDVQLNLRLNTR